jgi:perosamine synthetase
MSGKDKFLGAAAAKELKSILEIAWGFSAAKDKPIALHEPQFTSLDLGYVGEAISSGFVSSVGKYVDLFADKLSEFTGVSDAIPTVNGTSALQLALHISGVQAGDEVAVPALSFVATANAVKFLGAEPVFVDSHPIETNLSMGLSYESFLELISGYEKRDEGVFNPVTGAKLSAVVPMHTLGRLVDIERVQTLAKEFGIAVVEDSAEALGSFREGKHSGNDNIAILSFNGNKSITTGGGGAILTNDKNFANDARLLGSTAKEPHPWRFRHTAIGWNFRLPALNAALGCSQLEQLPSILHSKSELASKYAECFSNSEFFSYIPTPPDQVSNNWLSAVRLINEEVDLNNVLDEINQEGIHCRPMWDLLSDLDPYKLHQKTDLSNARKIRNSVICIPSSPKLWSKE